MNVVQANTSTHSSVEECSLALNDLGWEADFRQLDLGRGNSKLQLAASDHVTVLRVDFDNRLHQRAIPIKGYLTFGIPARVQASAKIGPRVLHSESLLFFDNYHGLDAVVEAGFAAYTVTVSDDRLRELAELHELPDPTTACAMPGSERTPEPRQLTAIRSALQNILQTAATGKTSRPAQQLMSMELPSMLLRNWFGAINCHSSTPGNRARVLRKALEYLQAYPQESLTIEQLCHYSAASISTLERAFKDRFDISPKRYLLLSRLSGVRRTLLDPHSNLSITDTANAWDFWHMGKFAADYRRVYGELPSQTLHDL